VKRTVLIVVLLIVLGAAAWPVDANWKDDCNYVSAKSPAVMALVTKVTGKSPPIRYDAGSTTDIFCR
jgi:hypothetical protein